MAIRRLESDARRQDKDGPRYRCQATEILRASVPIFPGEHAHFVEDISTGNVSAYVFLKTMLRMLAMLVLARLSGRACPRPAQAQRAEENGLAPLATGDLVRIRAPGTLLAAQPAGEELMPTVEKEMLRHCGRVYRVLGVVKRIVDERSGRLLELAEECVALEGVTCSGLHSRGRLFCTRAPYFFWRRAWLQKLDEPAQVHPFPNRRSV